MTGPDSSTKVCRDCHQELSLDQFHKNVECRDGHRPECRDCVKNYRRDYYLKRQAELCAYSNDYYQNNREQVRAAAKVYGSKHRVRRALYNKEWRTINRGTNLQKKREYHYANREACNQRSRRYARLNRERLAVWRKEYERANPDLIRFHKMQHQVRKRNAPGGCTSEQWRQKCEYHGWRCIYCRAPLTRQMVTIEHRKPLSKGGSNWPANLGPCCRSCNQSKNNKTETEYRRYMLFQRFPVVSAAARVVIP